MGNSGSAPVIAPPSAAVVIEGHVLRVKSCLGEASSRAGTVYLAEDEARRKFAVKVLRVPKGDQALNHAVEMELEQHARLPPHPHIVTYIGARVDHHHEESKAGGGYNLYYLLTEYCPKTVHAQLERAMRRKEPLAEKEVLNIFTSACAAVEHLHAHQVAHRDVKVENLLVSAVDGRVKLCDLGSCSTDHRRFRNGTEVEYAQEDIERHTTLAYRAPEQVDPYSGKLVGTKVDVWALGVLLYKLCWWRTPFEDKAGTVAPMAILNGNYKAPPTITLPGGFALPPYSPGIVTLLQFILETDPDLRPTATQVLDKVQALMDAGEIGRHGDLPALGGTAMPAALSHPPLPITPSASPSPLPPLGGGKEKGPGEEDFLGLFDTATHLNDASASSSITSTVVRNHPSPPTPLLNLSTRATTPRLDKSGGRGGGGGGGGGGGRSGVNGSHAMPPPIAFTPGGSVYPGSTRRMSGHQLDLSASSTAASLSTSNLSALSGQQQQRRGTSTSTSTTAGGMGVRSQSFVRFDASIWKEEEPLNPDWARGAGDLATSNGGGGGGGVGRRSSTYHDDQQVGMDVSEMATVDRARSPRPPIGGGTGAMPRTSSSSSLSGMYDAEGRPKNPKKILSVLWARRMKSIMGGSEKGKKSWVVKATTKEAGQPKAKYVRKIVLAVWEREMSSSTFFIYLSQRPIQSNPVVALKGLITSLKVLQQGPRDFLRECVPCVGVLDEVGRHWGQVATKVANHPHKEQLARSAVADGYTTTVLLSTTHGDRASPSPSNKRQYLDPAAIDLLSRLARLLVQKLHFHEAHPVFAMHFTAIPTMLGYETVPVTGQEEDMKALSRLLTIQESILQTSRFIFAVKNEAVASTARWALLPLIEEAYTVFVACTFLLASLLELSARASAGLSLPWLLPRPAGGHEIGATASSQGIVGVNGGGDVRMVDWRQRITALLALRDQYEAQLLALQSFYGTAEQVAEVKAMRRVPALPPTVPVALDGALNWKPSTMRSPMRGLGLLDRARMNEEADGSSSGPGTDGPPTPRAHRGALTPSITANALAQLEDAGPSLSSSVGGGGVNRASSLGSSTPKFAPVPAPRPPSSTSSNSSSAVVVVRPSPPPPPNTTWESFHDTVGFSSSLPTSSKPPVAPPTPSPPPPTMFLSVGKQPLIPPITLPPAGPVFLSVSSSSPKSPTAHMALLQPPAAQGGGGGGGGGGGSEAWFLPSTVAEEESIRRETLQAWEKEGEKKAQNAAAMVLSKADDTLEEFLSTSGASPPPPLPPPTAPLSAKGGGVFGLPPRLSVSGQLLVGGLESADDAGESKRQSKDLLAWSSSSSEEDEDEEMEEDYDGTETMDSSVAALNTGNMSQLMDLGGAGGTTVIMGSSTEEFRNRMDLEGSPPWTKSAIPLWQQKHAIPRNLFERSDAELRPWLLFLPGRIALGLGGGPRLDLDRDIDL